MAGVTALQSPCYRMTNHLYETFCRSDLENLSVLPLLYLPGELSEPLWSRGIQETQILLCHDAPGLYVASPGMLLHQARIPAGRGPARIVPPK